ncbi:ArnT family glycosyltransferase [Clostridium sp. JS66]|uniref:ArnT family glycosyltransferase n=1 Tax=Clostridium sp. JS66 TaxID=3064705 RepID=UPI00298E944E|nr:glycosyltransferase family 39 protein [Clostridium sp. JS66]WPC40482.1 glycosyltransferase family 39 protein [Clostridium sp. JS66]
MNVFNTKPVDKTIKFIEKCYYLFIVIILCTAAFNIFYNLGNIPINSWDEARHGVNAYEMIKRNNYIVNTYAYNNDYWNLKPPASYLAIILGYKLVGFNALGLRLFSAIAGVLTILSITIFVLHYNGKLASLISTAVLTTTLPFIVDHCSRSGDADSIFVLFFTLSMIFLIISKRNILWFYASGLAFSLAFLTKSWHSGSIVVIIIIYLVVNKTLFKANKKNLISFLLVVSFPILIWAILRYNQDGFAFFKNMIGYDLMARTSKTLEGHIGGMCYYLEHFQWSYFYWFCVFIATTLAMAATTTTETLTSDSKNYSLFIALWITIPFSLYSIAKTKIWWYIFPIYPALAISIGATSSVLLKVKKSNIFMPILLSGMIILAITKNQLLILDKISNIKTDQIQVLLKDLKKHPEYKGKKIYINHFEQSYWLCAELYGDLIPVSGGIEGFLKDNTSSMLLITKDKKNNLGSNVNNLKLVDENETACIYSK